MGEKRGALRMCAHETTPSGALNTSPQFSRRELLQSAIAASVLLPVTAVSAAAGESQLSTTAEEYTKEQKLADHYSSAVYASQQLEDELRTLVALQMVDSLRQELRGPKFGNIRIDCGYLAREAALSDGISRETVQKAYRKLMQEVQKLDSLALQTSRQKAPNNAEKLDAVLTTIENDFSSFLAMLRKPSPP